MGHGVNNLLEHIQEGLMQRLLMVSVMQHPWRILGIIRQNPSVFKSNQLHVDNVRVLLH